MLCRRSIIGLTALALTSTLASPALANGRFPAASQLVVAPTDPAHLVLRTTFGVLQSMDGGQTWKWTCERVVGFSGVEDPAVGVTRDGLLAGLYTGLSVSRDGGCSWGFATGPTADQYVIDVSTDRSDPSRAVALTATGTAGGFHVVVAETTDGGGSWASAGPALDADLDAQTLDIAPSDPSRIYVSAFGKGGGGVMMRSDDGGATWARLAFDAEGYSGAFIAAVDPNDADRVYMRLNGEPGDSLLVSSDGGASWSLAHTTEGAMLGFALSPSGDKLALGGPQEGVWLADKADLKFYKVGDAHIKCLTWSDGGLYACGDEFTDGFTVGLSGDQGASFTPLYHLSNLTPLACPEGSAMSSQCPAYWPAVAETIGAEINPSGGGGASSGAGAGEVTAPSPESGCGCSSAGDPASSSRVALLLLAAIGLGLSRRQSRS